MATVLFWIIPLLGAVIRFLAGLVFLVAWVLLSVAYAVRAYRGERFEIPVVVNFARRYMLGET
ncbi:MAG: hypothetical protein N0A24_07615 [Armatimonadetes bacterium]|nr:hypothetical protein [Armatimonadota bacterium]MDW8154066.1 hypothetical protein [Armatimonadota bacterium]